MSLPRLGARWCASLLLLAACAAPLPGRAGTEVNHDAGLALSPYSETGDRLKIRTVSVEAKVRDGLAHTKLTTVFSNTVDQQCQASLDLTVPPDSVVTGYAYWFKGERIQAHLLDNDKAWEIYSTITSHHRDPAIMEQWYDTTYHLQIYPVEPRKDLRVEVSYVSPLESDARGLYYRLPLAAGESAYELDRFEATVTLAGVETYQVRDTGGSTMEPRDGDVVCRAVREHWKPTRDWLYRLQPRSRLHSEGQTVETAPGQGYFSVVLWAPRKLRQPELRISTPGVRAVHRKGFQRVVAGGRRLVVLGRYSGPAPIRLAFRDRRSGWVHSVLTPRPTATATMPVPVPKKLWGAAEIKAACGALGFHENKKALAGAARERVVRLSFDFGVMSPYTAWLAVPKSELEFYRKVKAEGRVETNAYSARGGDPLIRITTEESVTRVTAFLPTGEPIPMTRLPHGAWEGRFDMPAETAEGDYEVVLLIERADGQVRRLTLHYRIDRLAPAGQARMEREGDRLRLSVSADEDTQVVYALLPDGTKLPFRRPGKTGPFQLTAPAIALGGAPAEIVLIDGAHNVTRLRLDPR